MSDDIVYLSISEVSGLLASATLSPLELTQAHLRRIEMLNDRLSAFLTVCADRAIIEATVAENGVRCGNSRGPLHGIPYGLKDVYDTAGIATTGNSPAYRLRIPEKDASVVRHLSHAGAVLLGKQATHELTYGGVSSELPWPIPKNPWGLDYDTGGSSSGSAVAVAAGMSMFALGTDTGGSVRNPAAYCGVVGLKPSFGLVSRSGVMMNSQSFDHCGSITRTVADAAIVLDAIAGFDTADPFSDLRGKGQSFMQNLDSGIKDWRIGVLTDLYEQDLPASSEMRAAIAIALETLRDLGARTESVKISPVEHYARCKTLIQKAEIYEEYKNQLTTRRDEFGRKFLARIEGGKDIDALSYLSAQRERRRLSLELDGLFADYNVLVTAGPRGPDLAVDVAANWTFDRPEITVPFSVAGIPAICLPIGFSAAGLPLSMQIVGPRFGDRAVLRAAQAYQTATNWHNRHPPL